IADELKNSSPIVRAHVMKLLAERFDWSDKLRSLAVSSLRDSSAFVVRAAADGLGRHPRPSQVRPIIGRLTHTAAEDPLLRHTLRMALRYHVAALSDISELDEVQPTDAELREITSVSVAVPKPTAAVLLLRYLKAHS